MIYLNGQHTNCQEVISDLKSMEDVSHTLTSRLRATGMVYNYPGDDYTMFREVELHEVCAGF